MSPDAVLGLSLETMKVTLLVSSPILITGLVVGLIISVFQAVTQIQEMTLTFVPKIIAIAVVLVFVTPWMLKIMLGFTEKLFLQIPFMVR